MKELLSLANDDYQKRGGNRPKSLIPDVIRVEQQEDKIFISFDFKSTSDSEAVEWYEKSKESKLINKFKKEFDIDISTSQDGDYEDDWQMLTVLLNKKDTLKVAPQESKTKNPPTTTKPQKKSKSDDTGHLYCYAFVTQIQKDSIQLTKHSKKLETIISGFFGDRLIAVTFTDDSYTLKLKDDFSIGEKRLLGKKISEGSDLQKFVKKVIYNGQKDTSGQLFRIQKSSEAQNEKV